MRRLPDLALRRQLADLEERIPGVREELTAAEAVVKAAERQFNVADRRVQRAEANLEQARAQRGAARAHRYLVRPAARAPPAGRVEPDPLSPDRVADPALLWSDNSGVSTTALDDLFRQSYVP